MSFRVPLRPIAAHDWIEPGLLFSACSVTTWLSLQVFGGREGFLDVWPACAIALALALPVWGYRPIRAWLLTACVLGSFVAGVASSLPLWIAVWLALVSGLELWLACSLLSLSLTTFEDFKEVKEIIRFTVVVLMVSAGCAEVGAYPVSVLTHSSVLVAWTRIVQGDVLGLLTIFPAALFLVSGESLSYRKLRPSLNSGVLWLLLFTLIVFGVFFQTWMPLLFLVFPPLIGLIFVLGTEGAVLGSVIVTLMGGWFTSRGLGPISLIQHGSRDLHLYFFQFFVVTVVFVALPVGALLDERRRAQHDVAEAQNIYSTLIGHTNDMIVLASYKGDRRFVSRAVTQLTGWSEKEYLEFGPGGPVHPRDREIMDEMLSQLKLNVGAQTCRYRLQRKDGTYGWFEASANGYVDPNSLEIAGYVATVHDISELMEKEFSWNTERVALSRERSKLHDLAWKDELTGLANRRSFNEMLRFEVSRKVRTSAPLSLLMIDVDYFKGYNDHFGHQAGDVCLRMVAAAMQKACSRTTDSTARIGGEEFGAVLAATPRAGAELVARKILDSISELKIEHPGSPLGYVTVSIGVATVTEGREADAALLLQTADAALYASKKNGRNCFTSGHPLEMSSSPQEQSV